MKTANLTRFVGREWPLFALPENDRRQDTDKTIAVEIGRFNAKKWGIRMAAKFMANENVPEQVARRVLLGIST